MSIPEQLKYTREHEWLEVNDNVAIIGITDYAQGELGDIVFIELPAEGDLLDQGQTFGTIEAVKAVSDIYAPLSGKIVAVNAALEDDPMAINRDPYGDGWMIKIEIGDPAEIDNLLDAGAYGELLGG
jgi:glycine cleavage system H protein